jgi:AcrR family transcriptional regulator
MNAAAGARTERRSAEERREAVLDAAIAEFAAYGLHGASTEAIARRVGISQPYIFRLFGTKQELFIAAAERVCDRILAVFRAAAASDPDHALDAMGRAYAQLLADRDEMLVMLQAIAASADPEVLAVTRQRYGEIYRFVEQVSGASDDEVRGFMATGLLLTVAAALDLPAIADKEGWARKCLEC